MVGVIRPPITEALRFRLPRWQFAPVRWEVWLRSPLEVDLEEATSLIRMLPAPCWVVAARPPSYLEASTAAGAGWAGWAWIDDLRPVQGLQGCGLDLRVICNVTALLEEGWGHLDLREVAEKLQAAGHPMVPFWTAWDPKAAYLLGVVDAPEELFLRVTTGTPWQCERVTVPTFVDNVVKACPYRKDAIGTVETLHRTTSGPRRALHHLHKEARACPHGCYRNLPLVAQEETTTWLKYAETREAAPTAPCATETG